MVENSASRSRRFLSPETWLTSQSLTASSASRYGAQLLSPGFFEEIAQLVVEPIGAEPPLEDRVRFDQARVGQLFEQHPRVAEGVQGIARVADDQGLVVDLLPLLAVRRGLSQQQALEHRLRRSGAL